MTLQHPTDIHTWFLDAVNNKDVEGLMAMYDADGLAVLLDGGQATGEVAMREMCTGLTGAIRRIDGSTRKIFVSDEVALSSAAWTAEVVLPDGTTTTARGTTAEVSRRQPDGSWLVVIDDPMFA